MLTYFFSPKNELFYCFRLRPTISDHFRPILKNFIFGSRFRTKMVDFMALTCSLKNDQKLLVMAKNGKTTHLLAKGNKLT